MPTIRPYVGKKMTSRAYAMSTDSNFAANIKAAMDAITENYKGLVSHVQEGLGDVIVEALQPSMDESQELVPFRTGALHDSAYGPEVVARGRGIAVEMGYARGGFPTYAVAVHENIDVFHQPPTQSKFLQSPLEANAEQIQSDIVNGLKLLSGT